METPPTPAPTSDVPRAPTGALAPRRALLVSVVAIAAVLGGTIGLVLALGGRGGGNADLAEYLQGTAAIMNTIDDRSGEGEYPSPGAILIHLSAVLTETTGSLRSLEPPAEAADAHEQLAQALEDGASVMSGLAVDHQDDLQTEDELNALLIGDEGLAEADRRAREACTELQQLATKNEIEVTLEYCA